MPDLFAFVPPHCPNPACVHHRTPSGAWWQRCGSYARRAEPRIIPRFKCLTCSRGFSTQTFSTTYYLKRPELQAPLHAALVACSALRQAARSLGCAPSSLQRQASRLGRHCLLFNELHRPKSPPKEEIVLDGFVSFEFSQYWPFELEFVVGAGSRFVYAFTDAELRRSGRMTQRQRRRREELESSHGKPDPRATRRAVESVIRISARETCDLVIRSDEHAEYPRAFRNLPHRIQHSTVSSRRCRTLNNPLLAVDLLDLLLRHSSSNHKRETIAFSKRRQGAIERAAVFVTWWNCQKKTSVRRRDSVTPSQALGLHPRPLTTDEVLERRLFPTLVPLPEPLDRYYRRDIDTRQLERHTRHRLKRAA